VKLAYKIAVVIAVIMLLYTNYGNNVVDISQPKESANTGGTTITSNKGNYDVSLSSDGATETSQAVSCSSTTSRVVQTPEAPGPGPIDLNSFLVTQKWLNETHCLYYFVVENRTMPHQFGTSKLWNIYHELLDYPNMYAKYFSILESLLTTFDISDEDYYSSFGIANVLVDVLVTTSVSFTKTIQQECRIDDTYWLKDLVSQQFAAHYLGLLHRTYVLFCTITCIQFWNYCSIMQHCNNTGFCMHISAENAIHVSYMSL